MSNRFDTRILTEVAMSVSLSTVLSYFFFYSLPQGGTITLGSMVPLLILAFRRGPKVGVFAGLIHGVIQLIFDPFIVHPVQLLLDYPLAFGGIGLAGFFREKPMIGTVVGLAGRFLSHVIAGVVFFSQYAGDMNPLIYSMIYNGNYMLPELIISGVFCYLLIKRGILEMNI